jgi:hypothetical protein
MYDYVHSNLRKRYPQYQGWEILPQYRCGTDNIYIPDFFVDKVRGKITYRVVAEVKLDNYVRQSYIDQLNSYVKNLSGRYVKIQKKILVLPSGIDKSLIDDYNIQSANRNKIDVMLLKNFKCEDDGIWRYY